MPSAQCPQCSSVCALLCRWRVRRGVVTTDQCADPAPAPPLPPTTARDLDAEWSCSAQSVTYPALGTIYTSSAPHTPTPPVSSLRQQHLHPASWRRGGCSTEECPQSRVCPPSSIPRRWDHAPVPCSTFSTAVGSKSTFIALHILIFMACKPFLCEIFCLCGAVWGWGGREPGWPLLLGCHNAIVNLHSGQF